MPTSFWKLKNLRHLDISGTPKFKNVPLGIGGLTSLQTLSKVIIGGLNGLKISELEGLQDLQGGLSIMGLDKVINAMEAKDAKLHQKKGVDVLEMEWSDVFDKCRNEMTEYEVFEGLRPHHLKLRNLKVSFYKGTRFPLWVGDPSFNQLREVTLCGCGSTHLPTIGRLRSLRKLFVKGMDEVKTVGFDLLAPANSFRDITFPSLEVLEFDDMQGWERWSTEGDNNNGTTISFPCLRDISIKRCPKLIEVSIGLIPSLEVLYIEECCETVLRSMVGASSSLVLLKMVNIKGLTQLHAEVLMNLAALEDLYIHECDELIYLWERELVACKIFVSLQKLVVCNCNRLVSLAAKEVNFEISMQSVREVIFRNCDAMKNYNCPVSVERLVISYCYSITSLTFSTVQELPSSNDQCDNKERPIPEGRFYPQFWARSLEITNCMNLTSFPHEHLQSLTSLEHLLIYNCPSMDKLFPCGLWPPSLSTLGIGCLGKPMSEWGMQEYQTSLVELHLYGQHSGVVSFEIEEVVKNTTTTTSSCFLLPPSLVHLTLEGFKDVGSLTEVLQNLPCLKHLDIFSCPKLDAPETISSSSSLTSVMKVWQ